MRTGSTNQPPAVAYLIHPDWQLTFPDLTQLSTPFWPLQENIYRPLQLAPGQVQVVLVGQDPYPQPGIATGIPFANKKGTRGFSPSLDIINQELEQSGFPSLTSENCDLEHWLHQGVLSINSAWTVKENVSGSHVTFWKSFTRDVLKQVDKPGLIVCLLGKQASSFSGAIKQGMCIKYPHPVADSYGNRYSFRGSDIFLTINQLLVNQHKPIITWA